MSHRMKSVLLRSGLVIAVLFAAFLASGVILAQSSDDFDLGCRSVMTAGGYAAEYTTANVILHSSVGQPIAGRATIQGSGILMEYGYMLPVAQTDWSTAATSSNSVDAEAISSNPLYMPAVLAYKMVRYVRPCNWSWQSSVQVGQ